MTTPGRQAAIEAAAKDWYERVRRKNGYSDQGTWEQITDFWRSGWIARTEPIIDAYKCALAEQPLEEHSNLADVFGRATDARIGLRRTDVQRRQDEAEQPREERETTADEDAKAYAETRQRVIDGLASRYEAQEFIDFIEGAIPSIEREEGFTPREREAYSRLPLAEQPRGEEGDEREWTVPWGPGKLSDPARRIQVVPKSRLTTECHRTQELERERDEAREWAASSENPAFEAGWSAGKKRASIELQWECERLREALRPFAAIHHQADALHWEPGVLQAATAAARSALAASQEETA